MSVLEQYWNGIQSSPSQWMRHEYIKVFSGYLMVSSFISITLDINNLLQNTIWDD